MFAAPRPEDLQKTVPVLLDHVSLPFRRHGEVWLGRRPKSDGSLDVEEVFSETVFCQNPSGRAVDRQIHRLVWRMMGCLDWWTAFLGRALGDEDQGTGESYEVDRRRVLTDPSKRTTERQRKHVWWVGFADVKSVPAAEMEAL